MESNSLKIALTGASGHLGFVLRQQLQARGIGHRIHLRRPDARFAGADAVVSDEIDADAAQELVRGCTTVIHSAAVVWPRKGRNDQVAATNTRLTRTMAEAAMAEGVRQFIFVSSIHSMKEAAGDRPMDETAPLADDERYPYNFSKAESERYLTALELPVTIVNPTALFGPGDIYYHGFNQFFQRVERRRMPITVSGGYDVLDIRDAARSIVEAAVRNATGKFMLSGKWHSMKELAESYAAIAGKRPPRGVLPPSMMRWASMMTVPVEALRKQPLAFNTYAVETLLEGHQNISSEKARRELDHRVRPLEQSLRDLREWMLHHQIPSYE